MLETLVNLHYSYLYKHDNTDLEVCLESFKDFGARSLFMALSLVIWTLVTTQPTEAAAVLQYGNSGKAVVNLQNQLKRANCLPRELESSGSYDNETRGAVMNLQMHSNLPVDGIAGPQTYAVLVANQKCKELKLGSQGEVVRRLQIQLNNWGFPLTGQRLKPTGVFDAETQKRWREFQVYFPRASYIDLWEPRITVLVKNLESSTFSWIAPALETLKSSEKPQAIATILAIMESSGSYELYDVDVPDSAAALSILKADAIKAVPKLLELLRNPQNHPFVRIQAAKALGYIGADANQAIPALIAVVMSHAEGSETADKFLRAEAIEAIGWFGADATDAIQPLLGILTNPTANDVLREKAAQALGYIGAEPDRVVPALTNIAQNRKESDFVRYRAIEAIGAFTIRANAQVEQLLEILNDPTESVKIRQQVVATLGKIRSEVRSVVTTLMGLLDDQTYPSLGLENPFQGKNLDAELKSIKVDFFAGIDAPATLREEAALALANIGSAVIPNLVAALQSPDEKVRYSAAFALGQMQPSATAAIASLQAIMNNPKENLNIRWMAASTLENMGQDTQTFFSQSPRPSFATLEKQVCISPPKSEDVHTMVFNKYAGRCVPVEGTGAGGGRQVAARLLRGRGQKGH